MGLVTTLTQGWTVNSALYSDIIMAQQTFCNGIVITHFYTNSESIFITSIMDNIINMLYTFVG